MLMSKSKGYFNGFNSNVEGHDKPRALLYMGGHVKYAQKLQEVARAGYEGFTFSRSTENSRDLSRSLTGFARKNSS
jgi:hypothetical protein